jgi:hypothetical protein
MECGASLPRSPLSLEAGAIPRVGSDGACARCMRTEMGLGAGFSRKRAGA